MKIPILLGALLLSASPVIAGETLRRGAYEAEKYIFTYQTFRNEDHKYSVSVVEQRSIKNENGITYPSSFAFDCENGKADGFVKMGERQQAFYDDIIRYYLIEFCSKKGYTGYSHK